MFCRRHNSSNFQFNFLGTQNVIGACVKANVSKFVYTSSVDAVIGQSGRGPFPEDVSWPVEEEELLAGFYAYTKARAESIVAMATDTQLPNGSKI
jgi:nucleoside-diphosphate-sugar epimerase